MTTKAYVIFSVSLGSFALLLTILSAVYHSDWSPGEVAGMLVAGCVVLSIGIVGTVVYFTSRPLFTEYGIDVWAPGLRGVVGPGTFEWALHIYASTVAECVTGPRGEDPPGLRHEAKVIHLNIRRDRYNHTVWTVLEMLKGLQVHFVAADAFEYISEEGVAFATGLRDGNVITVAWRDGYAWNAFFHELNHYVAEKMYGDSYHDHENDEWWRVPSLAKNTFLQWEQREEDKEI